MKGERKKYIVMNFMFYTL